MMDSGSEAKDRKKEREREKRNDQEKEKGVYNVVSSRVRWNLTLQDWV